VAAQAGFCFRDPNRNWKVACNSDKCIPANVLAEQKAREGANSRKELTADGELYFPYDPAALDLLRAFPPTKDRSKDTFDKVKKCRNVSLAAEDRPRILELCAKMGITVAAELQEIPNDPMVDRAVARALTIPTLYDFQLAGIEFLARRTRAILADDMGLGKTLQALMAVDPTMGALVVCPSAVKYSWSDEVKKWRPDLTPVVLEGRESFRWPKPGEVVITNFEILPKWLMPVTIAKGRDGKEIKGAQIPNIPSFRGMNPKNVVCIIDEAHRGKNYRTQVHKKIKELGTLCGKIWFLTGTPLMSRPTDLYGVLQSGHMDRDVFGGWKGFTRCFSASRSGYGGSWQFGSPLPEVPERMRRVMLRRMKEEVLPDLPSTIWKDVVVDGLGVRLRGQLDKLWDKIGAGVEAGELPSFEMLSKVRAKLAESRIPAMLDMVEDFEDAGTPLVVFSAYKAPINKLGERDGWRIITGDVSAQERQEIVREFQAGNLKGVALTIAAGGVGLTLTHASNVLFVDLDWTPALNAQATDRVRRIGQTAGSVQVIRMMSDHAVDRRVHELLAEKMELIQKAIEAEIKYEAKAPKGALAINTESQADFDARMAKINAAVAQVAVQQAQQRVIDGAWLTGERNKANRPEVPITPQLAVTLRDALKFMLGRCDGAQARDDVGFNKPDAGRARVLVTTGLTSDDELRAAERMLSRYHRQLHGVYPQIFA
jgi:hypothetical protein